MKISKPKASTLTENGETSLSSSPEVPVENIASGPLKTSSVKKQPARYCTYDKPKGLKFSCFPKLTPNLTKIVKYPQGLKELAKNNSDAPRTKNNKYPQP